jgi:hypothetical protein
LNAERPPAPALYGGSQCRLRGGLKALLSADTNLNYDIFYRELV